MKIMYQTEHWDTEPKPSGQINGEVHQSMAHKPNIELVMNWNQILR